MKHENAILFVKIKISSGCTCRALSFANNRDYEHPPQKWFALLSHNFTKTMQFIFLMLTQICMNIKCIYKMFLSDIAGGGNQRRKIFIEFFCTFNNDKLWNDEILYRWWIMKTFLCGVQFAIEKGKEKF